LSRDGCPSNAALRAFVILPSEVSVLLVEPANVL
jgi:hypothetical protein